MAKSVSSRRPVPGGRTPEAAVTEAVPLVWAQIAADVDWAVSLDEAVELCLDADRPVALGFMSRDEYRAVLALDQDVVDGWAQRVLRPYF